MVIRNILPYVRSTLLAGTQSARKLIFNVGSNVFRPRLVSGFSISGAFALGLGSSVTYCLAPKVNWDQVKKDIKDILDEAEYDDGHIGPLLIRLAWHASGTYDAKSKTGGSEGATMRFQPEAGHGANAGLLEARKRLDKIAAKHPGLSISDLWIFASYVAIEDMGGPKISFSPGRQDKPNGEYCTPNGRLPDADGRPAGGPITKPTTIAHIRDIFYRMGFNDQEIVALLGAHALGRCHTGLPVPRRSPRRVRARPGDAPRPPPRRPQRVPGPVDPRPDDVQQRVLSAAAREQVGAQAVEGPAAVRERGRRRPHDAAHGPGAHRGPGLPPLRRALPQGRGPLLRRLRPRLQEAHRARLLPHPAPQALVQRLLSLLVAAPIPPLPPPPLESHIPPPFP